MSQPAYNPDVNEKGMGEAPPPYPGTNPPYPQAPQPYPAAPQQQPYPAPVAGMQQQNYGSPPVYNPPVYAQAGGQTTTIVMTGNCPSCHMANLSEETDACGLACIIILVVLFFPIGLLYLLCLPGTVTRHCHNCGYRSD